MKKCEKIPVGGGRQVYVSPAAETMELSIEGVLCASGDDSADNGYDPDNKLGII